MNKNKGVVGIGLIIAIVLGIAIVGGGAYYLGKSSETKEVKIDDNNLSNDKEQSKNFQPIDENKNLPIGDNQQTNIKNPITATGCSSGSAPSIKVLYPNGGEIFTAGQKVNIKWESCNVKNIYISMADGGHDMGHFSEKAIPSTQNYFSWTVPNVSGSYYRIGIDDNASAFDASDNSFTINSSTANISTVNWNTYMDTECGYSFLYPDSWSLWGKNSNAIDLNGNILSRKVDFMDTFSQGIERFDGNNNEIAETKDHMHVDCYTMGNAVYNDELTRYNNSSDIFSQNKKTITIGGQTAIVGDMKDTATTSSGEHAGRTIIPSHRMYVFFLHKDKTRALYFEFDTPLNGKDAVEIANFEKVLSTFKFN